MDTDTAVIKQVLRQYVLGVNTGDFDLWMSLWSDNGIQMPPDSPAFTGREQIRDGNKSYFDEMTMEMDLLAIEEAKIHGDLGMTRCRYTLKVTPKAGGETIVAMPDGKALTLYERQADGAWKIAYDCYNSSTTDNPA